MKKLGLFILMIVTQILFYGCSNYKEIENKKVSTCFFYSKVRDSYCYALYYNSTRYSRIVAGVDYMIPNEDKFIVVFDSIKLNEFYPLYFIPFLEPEEEYDTATARLIKVYKGWDALFNETFYTLNFGFKFEDNFGKEHLVLRSQILRIDERTKFIESLKEGESIKIIYKMGNPYKCFIKLDNYYLTDPSQYKD